ncbi:unnamed protein product, partial [Brenthis ino]
MDAEVSNIAIPANLILFGDLCDLFKQLYKKKKQRTEQYKIFTKFIDDFRLKVANTDGKKNSTFFPILRLMLPACERERAAYNLKETKLGNLLVKVLSLNKQSPDAQKLLNFRSVNNSFQDSDFAGVAFMVLKSRVSQNSSTLTVGAINELLDKIAKPEEGSHGAILDEVFSYALKKLTAEQFKWFLRIILKDMKLSMSVDRTLAMFHPDAPELYRNCSNLVKVCEELEDGDTRPSELGVQLFYAVRPMLSERLDITQIQKLPTSNTYIVEDKFDGERFQMHMENDTFEYFSRKGHPYSKKYGKNYESGLLTPYLKDCFSENARNFILDGEMMGWHKEGQYFGSKGMAYDIKKVTENSSYRPCYCVFDILYYNGKSLVGAEDKGLPLKERLKILDSLFKDKRGVILHSTRSVVKDSVDILNALNKAIDNQEEGVVVKDVDSFYLANSRNAGWYKIKPEYTDDTMTDLDMVIIGADEAENKRQGRAKSFHVACVDATPGEPTRWVCVGRVSTGFTYEERERVCAILENNWKLAKKSPIPPCLHFNKEKPDIWILPEHSMVLQVRASELVRSSGYGAPYTLRFPRVVRLRRDKPVADVMSLAQFNQLVATRSPVIKLGTKRVSESQIDQIDQLDMKIRRARTSKPKPQVPEQFRGNARGDVPVTSKALLGRKLCVLSDTESCKKADLISIIESHGGKHVANPGADTWCCIVGNLTYRARTLIKTQEYDVISASWLCSLPASDAPCKLSPLDMLSIKKQTKLNLSLDYDPFGDSYKDEIDEESLRKCFQKMENEPPIYLTTKEKLKLDKQLFGENNPFSFLRGCCIHIMGNPLNVILAKMYGADVVEDFTHVTYCTHVVLPNDMKNQNIDEIKEKSKGHIVSEDWLNECFKNKCKVPEAKFMLL